MSMEKEDEWTWMIQSLKKYAHLHMYELSQPTSLLEWMDQNTIFVAESSSLNGRYEILLLSLPPKLANPADGLARLSKDRDFKMVCGGFHDKPVQTMAMVSDKLLVTSSPSDTDDIVLWEIKEDEDVIAPQKTLRGQRSGTFSAPSLAANPWIDVQVVRGSVHENLTVINLETEKELWTNKVKDRPSQPIASIDYIDDCSFLVCNASNGKLSIIDTRLPSSPSSSGEAASFSNESSPSSESNNPSHWSCSVNFQSKHRREGKDFKDRCRQMVASLSPDGLINIHDMRDVNKAVCSFMVPTEGCGKSPCVRWSLKKDNLISVSGLDHSVRIYDISSFENKGCSTTLAEPVFVHNGHKTGQQESDMWLTTHIWHEERPNVVLSAGSDSSLHAWDWLAT